MWACSFEPAKALARGPLPLFLPFQLRLGYQLPPLVHYALSEELALGSDTVVAVWVSARRS